MIRVPRSRLLVLVLPSLFVCCLDRGVLFASGVGIAEAWRTPASSPDDHCPRPSLLPVLAWQ